MAASAAPAQSSGPRGRCAPSRLADSQTASQSQRYRPAAGRRARTVRRLPMDASHGRALPLLASGPLTRSGDMIAVELYRPTDTRPAVLIRWPAASNVLTPSPKTLAAVAPALVRAPAEAQGQLGQNPILATISHRPHRSPVPSRSPVERRGMLVASRLAPPRSVTITAITT
jgi:hypothetical protein